ncbi:alpha/beta fold hydrolase [Nonomuraea ferruginea]
MVGESVHIPQPEGSLRVIVRGDTGPPVLLLSGASNDNALLSWRHAIPALAAEHRVLALDWPKQGESKPWQGFAGHDRMIECVTAVLDHFGLRQAALVGLSQGGAIALAYTIRHPERVSRLVALAPAGVISFPPVVHQMLWLTAKSRLLNRTIPSLVFRSRAACAWFARRALFAGPVADFEEIVDEYHADVLANGVAPPTGRTTRSGSAGCASTSGPSCPRSAAPRCSSRAATTRACGPGTPAPRPGSCPGRGSSSSRALSHWSNRQEPERVNALITGFLRESPADGRGDPGGNTTMRS